MTINTNVAPYYDDMDPKKNYQRILFVPGRNVQARELTQIQSIIQNQIKIAGDFLHKNGSVVKPGDAYYSASVDLIELETSTGGSPTSNILYMFEGKEVISTSGVKAKVLRTDDSTTPALFIKYISASETTSASTFVTGEKIAIVDNGSIVATVKTSDLKGSLVTVNEGIYYINGYYVQVPAHSYVLDRSNGKRTCYVGLKFSEEIVTAADDYTLYDLSDGYQNVASPGADRLKISLSLFAYDSLDTLTDDKFINLMYIKEGELQYGNEYSRFGEVEKIVARRTYDESGDYLVKNFAITPGEYRSNSRGAWVANGIYMEGDVVSYTDTNHKTWFYVALDEGTAGTVAPTHSTGIVSDGSIDWLQTANPSINSGIHNPDASVSLVDNKKMDGLGVYNVSPGKAYVKGFEVDKKAQTTIVFSKPRTVHYATESLAGDSGMFWPVTNVVGIPDFSTYETLTIKNCNGASIGTCRCRGFEIIDPVAKTYALYVFDVKYNTISYDTAWKSFQGNGFTADAFVNWETISGTAFAASSGATTVTTSGTQFTTYKNITKLKLGSVVANLVSVVDDDQITVGALSASVPAGSQIFEAIHYSYGLNKEALYYIPKRNVATLYDTNNENFTKYAVRRLYDITAAGSSYTINIVGGLGESFAGTSDEYICVLKSTGAPVAATITVTGTAVTVAGLTNGNQYRVLTLVHKEKQKAKEKRKTLKYKTVTFNTGRQMLQNRFDLGEADIYKIQSVTMSSTNNVDFSAANIDVAKTYVANNESDITSSFTLDNGQRDGFYGQGAVIKTTKDILDKPIKVAFTYFEHSEGDYFSVDSYVDLARRDIPRYGNIDLADCLDFRPRIADSGLDFTSTGSSICEPLSMKEFLWANVGSYLGAEDKVILSENGDFSVVENVSGATSTVNADAFVVATIVKQPYMGNVSNASVDIHYTNHRRYTMSDIAKIDQRLTNAETYISLSLLEKSIVESSVKDKYGLDRYKSGYFVDDFTEHNPGAIDSTDYKCAVKPSEGTLCPTWDADNIKLVEYSVGNRTTQKYQVTGTHVTLPYTTTELTSNLQASRPEYINPFMTWKFDGALTLLPQEDTWIDYQTLPTVYNSVGLEQRNAILATVTPGTVWGEWTAGPNVVSTAVSTIPPTQASTTYHPPVVKNADNHYLTTAHAVSHYHDPAISCIYPGQDGHQGGTGPISKRSVGIGFTNII